MEVIITERAALKVVGMQIRTTMKENKIPQLWNDFLAREDEISEIVVPECSLGICLNEGISHFDENTEFSYLACKVLKTGCMIPQGMVFRNIPTCLSAVFTHKGSLDNLGETYDYIYNTWFEESDYELAEGDEIEWYDSRFKFGDPESKMDIHIPIKKILPRSHEDTKD